jgi:uncharacterized 2Fe-2S/4Fe-4S cluster protein (DUF4445 family)
VDELKLTVKPDDKTFRVPSGTTLLEALIAGEIMVRSDCGGHGRCGKCTVRFPAGRGSSLSKPDDEEIKLVGPERISSGFRLACRVTVSGDVTVEIPQKSRVTPDVVKKGLPAILSGLHSTGTARSGPISYGIAADIGTTTLAVYLCSMEEGTIIGSTSLRNPQAIFGDDVISRISAVTTDPVTLPRLRKMVVRAIDWAVKALCAPMRISPSAVIGMTAVGNPTMIHLLLGEDPSSIGVYPFSPLFTEDRFLKAGDIGLRFNPEATLRTLPLISGYLGADIVSAALAADLLDAPDGVMLIDVGTNGEIIYRSKNELIATSCATGPAFEGATIRHGMQAASGAIDSFYFDSRENRFKYTTIQHDPTNPKSPSGLCGSGVISTVAELVRTGVITKSGSFNTSLEFPQLRTGNGEAMEFEIVSGEEAQDGKPITLTQNDVRAVQLAKAAMRAGIELLCRQCGVETPICIKLAGAFGSYINKRDALSIGMFPPLPEDLIEVVGNAAGAGAVLALTDHRRFLKSLEISRSTKVFDLASHPEFQETFIGFLSF